MDAPSYNDLESHTNQKYSQFTEEQQAANLNSQQQHNPPYQPVYQAPIQNPHMQNYQPPIQTPIQNPNMQNYQTPIQNPHMQNYQTPIQNPHMQNYQPPTQIYQQPMQTPYQVPNPTPYQPYVHPPAYQPVMQQTSTNNVIVVQQNASPIVIERNSNTDEYPKLQIGLAVAVLILNIFLPGIGTIVMGCSSPNAGSWICIGICQIFLVFLFIGWIWAIITGLMCLSNARR